MEETSTRLAFEYEGFTKDLEIERVAAEKNRNEAKERIDALVADLDASRSQIELLDDKLESTTRENFEIQENYVTLIEDTLDELSELFNFKQEESYLTSNETLHEERKRLYNLIGDCKQKIIAENEKSNSIKAQNSATNEALQSIKAE